MESRLKRTSGCSVSATSMMLRTPPSKRPRLPSSHKHTQAAASPSLRDLEDQSLVPFDGGSLTTAEEDDGYFINCELTNGSGGDGMRCAYQCRQMVKSELLETLDKREKQALELTSQVQGLRDSLHVAESEKNELMESVKRLEQRIAASSARETALQEKFIMEMEKSEERFRRQLERCVELESTLQDEMCHRLEAEMKMDALENENALLKNASAKAAEASKQEISWLGERLERVQKDANAAISESKLESSGVKNQVQFLESEVSLLKAQIDSLQMQLSDSLNERSDLLEKLGNSSSQVRSSRDEELELVIKTLRDEIKCFDADVAEAKKMKQYHVNSLLLKEKLEHERSRAERAEVELGKVVDYQIQIKSLENELAAWRSITQELSDVELPADIPRKLVSLQRDAVSAMAKIGELTTQVTELQEALRASKDCTSESEVCVAQNREAVDEMALKMARLERKVQLLTKERDGLKAILASYDEEEAIISTKSQVSGTAHVLSDTPQKSKEMRIQELEALVEDLKREGDALRAELAEAETQLGHGHYDPLTTKVVRMIENLDANAEKQALLMEIHNLKEKVNTLQNGCARSGVEHTSEELLMLKDQVHALEKREARYKKVFAEKISVFREACGLLFGYNVAMTEEHQTSTGMMATLFTLQSVYAQSEEEKLQFQYEPNHMHMLATDYTSTPDIARMGDVYLKVFNSIPAFTANLTSELFNKTTLG